MAGKNTVANGDIDVLDFVDILKRLPAHLPISDAYEEADSQRVGHWWASQRQHMISWFTAQATKGAGQYTRNKPNRSAKTTYNRLLNSASVLWIAEAVGVDEKLLTEASAKALAEPSKRSRPRIIREVIPWEFVAEKAKFLLGSRRRW
ncbi:MAG: hypothetical protein SPF30_03865 [Arcanobacterium sp.]|nr:hypothetical protein [Arcanobacterium sp.]